MKISKFHLTPFVIAIIGTLLSPGATHWIDLHAWYDQVGWRTPTPTGPLSSRATAEGLVGAPLLDDKPPNNKSVSSRANFNEINGFHSDSSEEEGARKLPECRDLVGTLSEAQIHICQLFHDHLAPLVQGASLGLNECRWQFRHHQWNCSGLPAEDKGGRNSGIKRRSSPQIVKSKSGGRMGLSSDGGGGGGGGIGTSVTTTTTTTSNKDPKVVPLGSNVDWNSLVQRGSKEIAFAQAVWSAAVAQSISRSCRDGSLQSCGCGRTSRPTELKSEWRWGGCGDNLQYGYKFSQNFVDSPEQEKPVENKRDKAKVLANLHNNEAGRRSVLKKTKIACKCHGVSGSCALVTCWHQVPSFREIGDYLKERYARATLVKLNKRGRLQVKRSTDPVPTVYDLVFVESSPNYCHRNESIGISGTTGRVCNRNSSAPDSCKNLCCNRGYTTRVIKSAQRCKCKFVWCCQVICEECSQMQKYDVCK